MEYSKKSIVFFYLLFFISLKVFSFHALTHSDSDTGECDLCEFVQSSNEVSFLIDDSISVKSPVRHYFRIQVFQSTSQPLLLSRVENSLFCRPPPAL
jgi:hypothetical protein